MSSLKSSTNKLIEATEQLLHRFQVESGERQADETKFKAHILELQDKLSTALLQIEKLTFENTECLKELETCKNTPNPLIQSHDTAAISAEEIDALVKEIDSCLSLLS